MQARRVVRIGVSEVNDDQATPVEWSVLRAA
jgi:hypothetical protein